jgi:signal peptidase II
MRKLFTLAALIVVIDQLSKIAVKGFTLFGFTHQGMQLYESKEVIGDFLRWTYVENPGMAFGLNFGMPVVLSLFSIAAAIFLVFLIQRTENQGINGLRLALALILGGAVGNLIDRVFYGAIFDYAPLFYGKVVDFVDINIPDMNLLGNELKRFYVFNVADAAVSIGVVLLLIFYPSKKPETQQDTPPTEVPGGEARPPLTHQEMGV